MRAVVGSEVVRRSNGDLYGGQSDGKKKRGRRETLRNVKVNKQIMEEKERLNRKKELGSRTVKVTGYKISKTEDRREALFVT